MRSVSLMAAPIVSQGSTRIAGIDGMPDAGAGVARVGRVGRVGRRRCFARAGRTGRMTRLMSGRIDIFNKDGFLVVRGVIPDTVLDAFIGVLDAEVDRRRHGDVQARRDFRFVRRRAVRHALVPHVAGGGQGAEAAHLACLRVRPRAVRAVDPRGDSRRGGVGGGPGGDRPAATTYCVPSCRR